MENYEYHSSTAVPWEFLLKSIDSEEDSHKKTIQRILHNKKTVQATSDYLGVSFNALKNKMLHEGIKVKKPPVFSGKLLAHKAELEHLNSQEIADLIGCSKKIVNYQCRRLGIKYIKRVNGRE